MTPYCYHAKVLRVVDGDTIEVELDLGLRVYRVERLRLLRVDTPELRGGTAASKSEAQVAKQFVVDWCAERAGQVVVETFKGDSFGRWLAEVQDVDGESLNDALRAEGWTAD